MPRFMPVANVAQFYAILHYGNFIGEEKLYEKVKTFSEFLGTGKTKPTCHSRIWQVSGTYKLIFIINEICCLSNLLHRKCRKLMLQIFCKVIMEKLQFYAPSASLGSHTYRTSDVILCYILFIRCIITRDIQ